MNCSNGSPATTPKSKALQMSTLSSAAQYRWRSGGSHRPGAQAASGPVSSLGSIRAARYRHANLLLDSLENTLPGRDSFDIEIYGMEGIPKDDLAEWKRARETELGLVNEKPKRAKYFKGVVPMEEMAKQLAIHRQLMRNSAAGGVGLRPPGALPLTLPGGIPLPPGFPLPPG